VSTNFLMDTIVVGYRGDGKTVLAGRLRFYDQHSDRQGL
jgi:hypothetical protein